MNRAKVHFIAPKKQFLKNSKISGGLRSLFVLLLSLFMALPSLAQDASGGLELFGTYGYMFGGKLRTYNGQMDLADNDNFKVGLNYPLSPGTQLEIHWMHQASEVTISEYGSVFDYYESFDLNTDYIQIGVLKELKQGPVKPFGKFTMGTAIYSPQGNTNYDDEWRFAFTVGGGVKAHLSDRIGLRLSGSMMMPVYFAGLSFFCGTGSGCGTGVSTGSAILQGELSGGLFIVLQ